MRTPPGKGGVAEQDIRRNDNAAYTASARNFQAARDLRRQAEELHRRGPRPIGEILLELIDRWGPAFEADLVQRLERYSGIDAEIYYAVGAAEYPPAPIHAVVDLGVEVVP